MEAILQPNKPNNNFYWFLLAICLFIFFILLFPPSCNKTPLDVNYNPYIEKINTLNKSKDSLLLISKKKDSIRIETVIKYRWLKGKIDTMPCNEILPKIVNICDSIVYIDSTEISVLKEVIKKDSLIISDYKNIVHIDSNAIHKLNKDLKHQKVKTKLAWFVAGSVGVVGLIRK